ncbi:MAG: glycosyltransferase family 25 protein [Rhodobacteraceae bacterium]|nr:glycosyltransferase family 25 protein [Paracoccaceae bacterium]
MIPAFVLTLPDCHQRQSRISASLKRFDLPFEFVNGVDGRNGLPPEYESQIDRVATRKAGRILSDAEFACSLSHIEIYRRIVAENIEYALMLADDHQPLPELMEYLSGGVLSGC